MAVPSVHAWRVAARASQGVKNARGQTKLLELLNSLPYWLEAATSINTSYPKHPSRHQACTTTLIHALAAKGLTKVKHFDARLHGSVP
jgi:hypothetical protein